MVRHCRTFPATDSFAPGPASDCTDVSALSGRSSPKDTVGPINDSSIVHEQSERLSITGSSGVGGGASLPLLDRDRLRASVLIQHLRDARDLHYSRENRTILICFRSAVAAEWCWEALNGPAPRP